MPRYFFNLYDGTSVFDDVGMEIPTIRAMRLHMLALAMTVFEGDSSTEESWQMEVLDEARKIVASMDFGSPTKDHA